MGILPFAEYAPDVSDVVSGKSASILNVLPRGDGYGPFNSLSAFTGALPAQCRGGMLVRRTDGGIAVFAGTSTNLYLLNNADYTWTRVSKGGVDYTALTDGENWQFAQFGNDVIAVQANVPPQAFTLGSSTNFADLGGSPPQARYVSTVGRVLVLSGLLNDEYTIAWSDLNAITNWSSGQADEQTFPDGGIVRGVAGGEFGVIFQDSAIRRMTYVPGSDIVFQIERVTEDKGLLAPYSLIRAGDQVFFLSAQGFQRMTATTYPEPIGKERVDRTFFASWDETKLGLVIGAPDPRNTRVFWSYRALGSASSGFTHLLCFDWALNRWSLITIDGEYLLSMSQPGVTLDGLDSVSASIDAMTTSFDTYPSGTLPALAGIDLNHKVGFFNGSALEATLETAEQGFGARRIFVRGFRPVTDAANAYGSIGARETLQAVRSYGAESALNAVGSCPQRVSTRYARAKLRIPAGESWTFANGVEPDFVPEGAR